MTELRWVLLALGILVVTGVYVWGRGLFLRNRLARQRRRGREEPHISLEADLLAEPGSLSDEGVRWESLEPVDSAFPEAASESEPSAAFAEPSRRAQKRSHKEAAEKTAARSAKAAATPAPKPAVKRIPDKVITIRFIPKSHELDGAEAVRALRAAGLEHGRYGIFHMPGSSEGDEPLFSVASLTEPGSFDLTKLGAIAGMSFFVALPGPADPVEAFDSMVGAARSLAVDLEADLFDERGSSWSIQRERYVREELIRYRHQHAHH